MMQEQALLCKLHLLDYILTSFFRQIIYNLLQEGAIIHVWDPKATKNEVYVFLSTKY